MKKRMYWLEVYETEGGDIAISQMAEYDEPQVVLLHPEQVDLLIGWLKEAHAELSGKA